jgi:alpha-D-ribose 1-methylphosphonate 5-triphosphate synthase subunit PhnH
MAAIALITDPSRMPALEDFHIGEPDRPEASTQLVIQVPGITAKTRGVPAGETSIERPLLQIPAVMPGEFWKQWEAQRRFAPLGVDVYFTCCDLLLALPRHLHCSGAPLRKPRFGSRARARRPTIAQ